MTERRHIDSPSPPDVGVSGLDVGGARLPPVMERSVSASDDFLCSCCFDLMVQPTTLTCGHSFCRLCIANWYLTSNKRVCPQCRSVWTGNPQVNITLKTLLEKMHPSAAAEREQQTLTDDAREKVAKFDAALTKKDPDSQLAQRRGFCSGVLFAMAILIAVYLTWYWRSSDKHLLVHKPFVQWSVDDVSQWLTDLGPWTQDYVQTVRQKHIVGRLVLEIDETNIFETLNVTEPLHQLALLNSIATLREKGVKPPSNLWEFKALHPGWALFLLYGLKDYPRTVVLYLYMFEYETMFLPFIHTVCPVSDLDTNFDIAYPPPALSGDQWAEFLPKYLFLPYWLLADYTWNWTDIHWWTARFILVNCLILTLTETNTVARYIIGEARLITLTAEIRTILKSYLSIGLFVLVWPLVPSFVGDCLFYIVMYFSPYQAAEKLYQTWRRGGEAEPAH